MSSWGLGYGWLRDGRRNEYAPSVARAVVISVITLGVFFFVVFLLMSMSGCSGQEVSSGIKGAVTLGPTQPVATQGSPSDSKPYSAKLMITEAGGQHLKQPVRVKSAEDGTFSVALEPGTYVIEADGGNTPPTLKPVTVEVKSGRYTQVDVPFDSGIR